jgi:copper chaperone NosL
MRLFAAAASILAVACALACGGAVPAGPPEIRLGVDACDGCGMAIAEPRYAAAAIADDGAERRMLKFDDVGCLARWEANASGSTLLARWVHDRPTQEWIDASTATFAEIKALTTPMGSGIAAFKAASDADVFIAERGGETLSWNAILARARDGSLLAHPFSRREDAR